MVMKAMRGGGKSGGILKFFLFTLLGMAVGGLVLSSFSTTSGVSSNDVARIENNSISIRSFDRALQRAVSRYGISTKQAYKIGMADDVLASEIRSYFLLDEAKSLGIEIGKKPLARYISQVILPYKKEGLSLQEVLEDRLKRMGMSEKEFIHDIEKEISERILVNSVRTAFSPNLDLLAKDLYLFQTQTRNIEIMLFPDADIDNIEPATEEQLKRLYESVKFTSYKIPEYRSFKVAVFDPEKIGDEFHVSDEEVLAVYDNNPDNFHVGEQLVLSQIVTKDEKQANDIYSLVKAGDALKVAVIKIMGEDAPYIEGVKFETSMMLPDLMKALEDKKIGMVTPPVKTMLGYHVVKLDDVLQPSIRPFVEVRSAIKKELLEVKKGDFLYDIASKFDSMVDEGMTLEDIAKEIDINISFVNFIDNLGLDKQGDDGLKEFGARDKQDIAKMIFEIEEDMPTSLQDFGGKLYSFDVVAREAPSFKEFDSVKPELAEKFIKDQKRVENEMRMRKYLAQLQINGSSFETIASDNKTEIRKINDISISGENLPEPLNENVLPAIFKTRIGDYETLRLGEASALIKITGYGFYEQDDESKKKNIADIRARVVDEGKDEALLMYLHMLSGKYSAVINERLLERVYGDN